MTWLQGQARGPRVAQMPGALHFRWGAFGMGYTLNGMRQKHWPPPPHPCRCRDLLPKRGLFSTEANGSEWDSGVPPPSHPTVKPAPPPPPQKHRDLSPVPASWLKGRQSTTRHSQETRNTKEKKQEKQEKGTGEAVWPLIDRRQWAFRRADMPASVPVHLYTHIGRLASRRSALP